MKSRPGSGGRRTIRIRRYPWEAGELQDYGLALGDEFTFAIAGQSATVRITSTRNINWDSFRPNFFMVVNPGVLEAFAHTYITSFYLERETAHCHA